MLFLVVVAYFSMRINPTAKAINLLSAQKVKRTDILGTIRFLLGENAVNPL